MMTGNPIPAVIYPNTVSLEIASARDQEGERSVLTDSFRDGDDCGKEEPLNSDEFENTRLSDLFERVVGRDEV